MSLSYGICHIFGDAIEVKLFATQDIKKTHKKHNPSQPYLCWSGNYRDITSTIPVSANVPVPNGTMPSAGRDCWLQNGAWVLETSVATDDVFTTQII